MKRTILSRVGLLMLAVLAWLSMPAFAREDIDIYTASSSTAAPNVLFYLDNSSNWSANNNAWSYSSVMNKCNGYTDAATASTCRRYTNNVFCSATSDSATACSGNPSLVQGQIELRALRLVLNETYCNATGAAKLNFNVGIMMGANASSAGSIVDGSSVGTSYIRHAIRPMSDDQCLNSVPLGSDLTKYLIADLNNIDSKITASDFKTSSSFEYGAGLYEAFKYFGGWTNPSGAPGGSAGGATGVAGSPTDSGHFGPRRYSIVNSLEDDGAFTDGGKSTYKSPLDAYGICGKNYIVLIGNTFPNQEFGSNQNATPPTNLLLQRLMSASGTTPHMNDPSQLYSVTNKSNIRFADEWAQFLFTADVDQAAGKQNLQTFAIDVFNAAQDASQSALLRQMADSGQGTTSGSGYFKVGGDLLALVNALKDILTQVAAVDSVFASAALPVSVNAQGTYLNQVFMGLFRPDENFQQRWYGNLKQYRFARTTSGSLYLADSTLDPTGQPTHAVDAANTGFIQPCATSYWTTDSGKYWQTITGEQSSCGTQTTSLYSDSPDGPVVARGGAAQKLRSLASRNLRTCSSTTSCTTGLVDFNATNVTAINSTLVNWIRGQNTGDGNTTATGTTTYNTYATPNSDGVALTSSSRRPTIHGEVVHSTPLAVNYGGTSNDVVVYYGAGDGVLHAIDGNQTGATAGQELWGFVAPEHWAALDRVRTNSPLVLYGAGSTGSITPPPQRKTFFFDGPITGYQNASGTALTQLWIYASMRRGGNMIYAFDVSHKPDSSGHQPTVLWKFGCTTVGTTPCMNSGVSGESSMGQSWSAPIVIRVKGIKDAAGNDEPLVVFGGGYDDCEDVESTSSTDPCAGVSKGNGFYVLGAQRGAAAAHYRYISPSAAATTTGRFIADIAGIDVNGDGYTDVIYAVDTRGNIWRTNTSDPAAGYAGYAHGVADWPTQLVATVGKWGTSTRSERRKLMYAPSVVVTSTSQALVLVGSGDREKPDSSAESAYVNNRFYGVKDTFTTTSGVTPVVGYDDTSTSPATAPTDLVNVTGATSAASTLTAVAAAKGWYLNLYSTRPDPYEQVVTTPLTIGGVTYFNTYQAKVSSEEQTCNNLGTARGYQVDFQTGIEQPNENGALLPVTFLTAGLPTSPRGGSVDIDGQTTTFCLSCASSTNRTILNPIGPKVLLRPNRTPVYRYQRIDRP